ncbi:MAG: lactate racemase domain-containing protein [Lachnospiraceae bacterium]|nr:lactate racemase domain-containing protein [Lachnospiraceae bacterium]
MRIVKGGNVSRMLQDVKIPKMFHAEQSFPKDHIEPSHIPAAVYEQLARPEIGGLIRPGMSIAITAGSRGVANVDIITKAIVDFCKEKGASPFIVPAMGSHGGATAEGQAEQLAGYGITEERMGCPIRSSMETVLLGCSEYGKPVYQDKNAYEADGIIVSCRIKPHNAFRGRYESGVCKMMVVGLGKQKGAESVHSDGLGNMARNLPANAKVVLENSKILFAIPCVENAYDETAIIEAIPREKIFHREPELLQTAFSNMPSILVEEADVLVVNEMGKNFSGTGVDPNISGTWSTEYGKGGLKVKRTCFLDLTDCSHGNANGMGLADIITARMYEKLDSEVIYPNCFTSTVLRSGMMPPVVATDKEAIQACIKTANQIDKENCRIVRIQNTLHVGRIMLSEAYYEDVIKGVYPGVTAVSEPAELEFDEEDNLITKML